MHVLTRALKGNEEHLGAGTSVFMKLSSTVTMITEVTGVLSQHPADPIAQSILMSHQSGANTTPGRQQL